MRLRITARGAAHPDLAWRRYADLGQWTEWAPHLRAVRCQDARLAPGVHGSVEGPAGVRVRFVVESVTDSARVWSWRVRVAGTWVRLGHDLAPAPGGGTTAGLTLEGPAPLVLGYAPLARWALGRLVRP